ncbi:MAG: hypothetical protein HIU82_04965 [Proteobacteria bacterium]|nr:hypothetical protein [Pseudomonadota bacterium]
MPAPAPAGPTPAPRPEQPAARQRRLAAEATLLAVARADIAAGRTVPAEAVDAWIDSLATDHPLPPPHPGI